MLTATRIAAATLGSVLLIGCGDGQPPMVEVEGVVQLKGEPLEKVRVEFWPLSNGPQSAGLTDDQGRFVLLAPDGVKKGAVVGKHKVVLKDVSIFTLEFKGRASADVDMTQGKKPRISSTYTNATKTPLEVDISGPTKDLKFDVEPYAAAKSSKLGER